jgi:hypothetical protein
MHEAHGTDQLREIDVSNILSYTLVRLDLVEQIPTLGQFHRDPSPNIIFTSLVKTDDVIVTSDVPVYRYLERELPGTDLAMARSVVFVDVLDSEDGIVRVEGGGLFNTAE